MLFTILSMGFLILFILIAFGLLLAGRHLFARDAFHAPEGQSGVSVKQHQGIPYLVEHGLPYPAGIRSTGRKVISLDGPWRFRPEGRAEWETVRAPHCFNTAASPLRDYEGAVWYECEICLAPGNAGDLLRLGFLGSFYHTSAWLDEQKIGDHEGGYLPFYFDISGLVRPGQAHTLRVRVDNRIDSSTLPQRLYQGHNPGWHPYGGLHRSVVIEFCPAGYCFKLRAEAQTVGGEGVVLASALFYCPNQSSVHPEQATLALVGPDGQLLDQVGAAIAWDERGEIGAARHRFTIPAPRLWAPGAPALYRLEINTGADTCAASFGLREIEAGAGEIRLNGKPIILKGVCRHQEDRADGLAQGVESIQRDLAAIQSLNANFVRLAHYPHAGETLDLCDQMGLAAWVEIPLYQTGLGIIRFLFDKTTRDTGKNWRALPGLLWETAGLENPILLGKARDELHKMIERDANHPSVIVWGLGNECWTLHPSGAAALGWLRAQAEPLDRSRPFAYAAFALPVLSALFERAGNVVDVLGINQYFGWYYGRVDQAQAFLEGLARRNPGLPLIVSETGADAVAGQHTRETPPPRGFSEEYQAWLHERQWQQVRAVARVCGMAIWVWRDFLCPEYREDNPVPFYNLKGLVDRDNQPKAAFERVRRMYAEHPGEK